MKKLVNTLEMGQGGKKLPIFTEKTAKQHSLEQQLYWLTDIVEQKKMLTLCI